MWDQGNPGYRIDEISVMQENTNYYKTIDLWIGDRVQNDSLKTHLHEPVTRVKSLKITTTCLTNNWVGWYAIQVFGFFTK